MSSPSEEPSKTAAKPNGEPEELVLLRRMHEIRYKLLVLSGKGGVGKSTVAANLAASLAAQGNTVGLLDVDVHGPSIPKLMGLEGYPIKSNGEIIYPARVNDNLKVMSIGFLLPRGDEAVIWRGPRKYGVIRQFLKDVAWGPLDYLVVDSPPGTGDEPLSVAQLVGAPAGAVIVTTPQDLAIADVRRCIAFCGTVSLPVLGIVENMSGFVCPHCGERCDVFKTGGGETLAREMHAPFLGRIPIEPAIVASGDSGSIMLSRDSEGAGGAAFADIVSRIVAKKASADNGHETQEDGEENHQMVVAIPLAEGRLSMHFGHCEEFAILTVDEQTKAILSQSRETPPPHEPGVLPKWLHGLGVNVILAGGMGQRAQQLFAENEIRVVVGASADTPETLVKAYLDGTLETGDNICDH